MKRHSRRPLIILTLFSLFTFSFMGSGNGSFQQETYKASEMTGSGSIDTSVAVAYIGSTYYTDVGAALKAAYNNNTADTIYLIPSLDNDGEADTGWTKTQTVLSSKYAVNTGVKIDGDSTSYAQHIVKAGDSLILPYEGTTYQHGDKGNDADDALKDDFADATLSRQQTYCVSELIIDSNVLLTVKGSLIIGGETGNNSPGQPLTGHVSGSYSQISMKSNSKIRIESSTSYTNRIYGFIKEYDESSPSNGLDVVSGKFQQPLVMYDWPSGEWASSIMDDYFPILVFDFPNAQVKTRVYSTASMALNSLVPITLAGIINTDVDFVSSGSSSFVQISSGYVEFDYSPVETVDLTTNKSARKTSITTRDCGSTWNAKKKDPNKTTIDLYGEFTFNNLYVEVSTYDMTTANKELPLSYKFDISVMKGSVLTIPSGLSCKFLPGCSIAVDEGATVNVAGDVICYQDYSELMRPTDRRYCTNFNLSNGGPGCLIMNNGTLKVSGSLGAKVITADSSGGAVTEFLASAIYSRTVPEGVSYTESSSSIFGYTIRSYAVTYGDSTVNATGNIYYADQYMDDSAFEGKGSSFPSTDISLDADEAGNKYLAGYWHGTWNAENYVMSVTFDSTTYDADVNKTSSFIIEYQDGSQKPIAGNGSTGFEVPAGESFKIVSLDQIDHLLIDGQKYGEGDTCIPSGSSNITAVMKTTYSLTISATSSTVSVYINGSTEAVTSSTTIDRGSTFTVSVTYENTGEDDTNSTTITIGGESKTYSASTTYKATGDVVITANSTSCFRGSSLVTLEDGGSKRMDELEPGDMVLSFSHETGEYEYAPVMVIYPEAEKQVDVVSLHFSDAYSIDIIGSHDLLDVETRQYVEVNPGNAGSYIGTRFLAEEDGKKKEVVLESYEITSESTPCYAFYTYGNLNAVVDDMLTMTHEEGVYNYFDLDGDFKYDQQKKQEDIETYGLWSHEDLEALMEKYGIFRGIDEDMMDWVFYYLDGFNSQYLPISIGKGFATELELAETVAALEALLYSGGAV